MRKSEESFGSGLFIMLLGFGSLFFSIYVFKTIWNWHIAPLGVMELEYWQSAGVSLVIGYAHIGTVVRLIRAAPDTHAESLGVGVTYLLSNCFALLFGYLYLVLQ